MIIGEVGLNHLGDEKYAHEYINFHLNNNFECLSFQIRENSFYQKKDYLKLNKSFYEQVINIYSKTKKKIGLAVSNLDSIENMIPLKFDFYKILSASAKDENLINTLLKKTNAQIYISLGSLNFDEINKIINKHLNNSRVKFNYTQLSYEGFNLNLINLFNLSNKYNCKLSYGHHYINDMPIIMSKILLNCDIFIYLKGMKKIKHPDEVHALNFENFFKLLNKFKEIDELIGVDGRLFSKNNIPDQSQK